MRPLLQVEHLSGGYGRREVVHDVSLTVAAGELCALLGLNGCGKTTLIKAVCGLLPAVRGACLVDGQDTTRLNEKKRAALLSYIPQRLSIITGRSVLDVVLMGFNPRLGLLESPGERHRQEAVAALEKLGLVHRAGADFATLSEGQKQLVILARAMVQNAPVMLMDEPDSALDFVNRGMVLGKVRQLLREQGRAGLISLHDPNFAMRFCDRLLLMKDGAVCGQVVLAKATPQEVEEALSALYGPVRILRHPGGLVMVEA